MSDQSKTTILCRDPIWKIVPGLLVYNLFGRHVLTFWVRRKWVAEGRDPAMAPKCGWISFADVKEFPRG